MFRYKGPIPQSKETAILMLADGCEAALRAMNINASDKEALETISNIFYSRKTVSYTHLTLPTIPQV